MLVAIGLIHEVLLGVNVEDLGSEPDMGLDGDAAGEELLENGRVLANELDGARGNHEGLSALGEDGNGEGPGGLGFDQVLDVDYWPQVFLPLHDVVEPTVSNPVYGAV